MDSQGRIILPADWCKSEIDENHELYIIKRKGYLKIIPKRRIDLTQNFDKIDLGIDSIGNWKEFEKKPHDPRITREQYLAATELARDQKTRPNQRPSNRHHATKQHNRNLYIRRKLHPHTPNSKTAQTVNKTSTTIL